MRAVFNVDVEQALRKIDVLLLYLQASRDTLIRGHNLGRIRELKPGLRVVAIETRHFLLQLEPKRAAREIAAFLETLPRGRSGAGRAAG